MKIKHLLCLGKTTLNDTYNIIYQPSSKAIIYPLSLPNSIHTGVVYHTATTMTPMMMGTMMMMMMMILVLKYLQEAM